MKFNTLQVYDETFSPVNKPPTVRLHLDSLKLRLRLHLVLLFFFFFFHAFWRNAVTVHWTVAAKVDFSTINSVSVHCSQTYKFYFLVTFSLKMGHTVLFTHLKIILLQYFQFSIFSFSKISYIQIDPKNHLNLGSSISLAFISIRHQQCFPNLLS